MSENGLSSWGLVGLALLDAFNGWMEDDFLGGTIISSIFHTAKVQHLGADRYIQPLV